MTVAMICGAAVIFLAALSGQAAEQGASPSSVKQVPLQVPMTSAQGKIIQGVISSARGAAVPKPALPRPVKELGIEVTALRLTSNGYMLDFRYKVLDPEKAKPMFDKKIKPYLIDQATGAKMLVPSPPKVGSLRQTPRASKAGQVYFAIFANAGKLIKAGNKVTIVYGERKIENLVVE